MRPHLNTLGKESHGFTILEVVISLAIVAILVTITLPSITRVKARADATGALNGLRQTSIALLQYAGDHEQMWPYLGTPGQPELPLKVNGVTLNPVQGGYFRAQGFCWPSIARAYFSALPQVGGENAIVPIGDQFGAPQSDAVLASRFWLTHTAFAAPEYWESILTPTDTALYRGTRLSQILHTARKGILLDVGGETLHYPGPGQPYNEIATAMADGSTAFQPWLPQADYVGRPYDASFFPTMSTKNGLRGVDFSH